MQLIRITYKCPNNIKYYLYYNASKEVAFKNALNHIPKTNYIVDIEQVDMRHE